jgi:hypothetical protein
MGVEERQPGRQGRVGSGERGGVREYRMERCVCPKHLRQAQAAATTLHPLHTTKR